MSTPVTLTRRDSIAVIVIDNPPVNAVSRAVADGLADAVSRIADDSSLEAVLVTAAGKTFVAGGDISEFSNPDFDSSIFNTAIDRLEALDRPVIASLHGTVLGAGLELALACHYRVALAKTRLGFPEVTLGLIPGSGGTQRLPRLVGPEQAMDMISGGRPITVSKAEEIGLVDKIVDGDDPADAGLSYTHALLADKAGPRRTGGMAAKTDDLPEDFFSKAYEKATTAKADYPAHRCIVQAVEAATTMALVDGLALETRLFEECLRSPESEAMRHLFFAEREARNIPGVPGDTSVRPVERVGVVGAGTMGSGIAMTFANADISTTIVEAKADALDAGLARIAKTYDSALKKGRMTEEQAGERQAMLQGTLAYSDLADCDLVIEAVFEDFDLKQDVCRLLGQTCKPGAIIATNTSTLDVNALAEATTRPGDTLGMHFFSPAHIMRLLEVVRGAATAPDVLATVMQLARRIGKVPVAAGVCYGFIGNRLIEPYMREAEFMLMEGATPSQIDSAIQSLGLPMGPCRMLDMAGIDVGALTVIEHRKAGGLPPDPAYRAVVEAMMEKGWHGQKTGAGYYRYEGRKPLPNPDVEALCRELAAKFGIEQRTEIPDQEIIERCLYTLINEGARALEEGIAIRPGDIDVVYVYGYGFPDFRGGPMYMADRIGLGEILARLKAYADQRGDDYGYWTPAGLLADLARKGKGFSDWQEAG